MSSKKSSSKDGKGKSSKAASGKNAYLGKDMNDWNEQDVADWLVGIDMAEYAAIFKSNAVTGSVLGSITDVDLASLGVSKLGHRKKILSIVNPSLLTSSAHDSESHKGMSSSKGGSDLTTSSSDVSVLHIKATYKSDVKKVKLPQGSRLSDLKAELTAKFDLKSTKFNLYYEDSDGDRVSLSSDSDWDDCVSENPKQIKLTISSYSSSSKSKSSSSSSSRSKGSASVQQAFGVFDGLLQATIVIDEKAIIQYVNPAVEKFTGYTKSEMTGQNVKILMPEENAREHDAYVANYVKTGVAKVIGKGRNVTLMQKDGSYVPIFLQLTENSATGKRMFVGTVSEAKEEKRQGTMLQMVREVLDTLVNPAVAITDKGIIQVFNKPAQQLWGYGLTDVVGKNVKMLMPDEFASNHDEFLRAYLAGGRPKIIGTGRAVPILLKDGSLVNVHLSVSERRDGNQVVFTGVFTVTK